MSNLTRYGNIPNEFGDLQLIPHGKGEWVKFEDIKHLLPTAHNSAMDAISLLQEFVSRYHRGEEFNQPVYYSDLVSRIDKLLEAKHHHGADVVVNKPATI